MLFGGKQIFLIDKFNNLVWINFKRLPFGNNKELDLSLQRKFSGLVIFGKVSFKIQPESTFLFKVFPV